MSLNFQTFRKIVYTIALCFLISACQTDQQETAPKSTPQKQIAKQTQNNEQKVPVQPEEQKVLDRPKEQKESSTATPQVNLSLSKELIDKIDSNSQQNLNTELDQQMVSESTEKRKVKISAGALIDKEEEDLTKKLDGGKVNITIPFN